MRRVGGHRRSLDQFHTALRSEGRHVTAQVVVGPECRTDQGQQVPRPRPSPRPVKGARLAAEHWGEARVGPVNQVPAIAQDPFRQSGDQTLDLAVERPAAPGLALGDRPRQPDAPRRQGSGTVHLDHREPPPVDRPPKDPRKASRRARSNSRNCASVCIPSSSASVSSSGGGNDSSCRHSRKL